MDDAAAPRLLAILQNRAVQTDVRVWSEVQALRNGGWDVVVICPVGRSPSALRFELRDGVEIHSYPQRSGAGRSLGHLREYAQAWWRIRRLAKEVAGTRGFDVVQAANPPDFLLLAVRFLRRRGACLVFDHHDLWPELFLARSHGRKGPFYWLIVLMERLNFRLTDIVLATNESYKRVAMSRGGKRAEDVFVVRNGPVLGHFKPVPAEPELKRGRRFLISYLGEMAPQDGVEHALHALAALSEKRDDWHAVLGGDGESRPGLRRLATELGLDDRVEFTGWLYETDLRRLLCSSDVCLVPEPKNELSEASTLMKIAEYMAMARPIVAYDLAESRVTAGDAALFAAPNDPEALARGISELLDDPERRERMGRVGRERVENGLSWEHSERALIAAHEEALARSRARGARR